jgi:uncharacterized protein (UPF0210 family)
MTFLKLSLIGGLTALLLTGCSNTPKDAVENMYDALQSGNVVKLANNVAEAMSISLMSESIKDCSIDKNSRSDKIKLTNDCLEEKYSTLNYKDIKITNIDEDKAYAEVRVKNNNMESVVTFAVEKIDGKWMVAGRKKQL